MQVATLASVVCGAFFATAVLHSHDPQLFYQLCMTVQWITLVGLAVESFVLVQTGHFGFVAALYYGALAGPPSAAPLICLLCLVTVATRRLFRGCLFDLVSKRCDSCFLFVDALFLIPIAILSVRIEPATAISS